MNITGYNVVSSLGRYENCYFHIFSPLRRNTGKFFALVDFCPFGKTLGNAFRQLKLTAFPVKASPEL